MALDHSNSSNLELLVLKGLNYGPLTNCYVAHTVIRRKIVFICSASYAVYTVTTRKIGFM